MATEPALVFYDGHCGLCHGAVRFLLARDPGARWRFAPLQGATCRERLPVAPALASLVVLPPGGPPLVKSRAVLHLLADLGPGWRALGRVLALLPPRLADAGYDAVAAVRGRLFRAPEGLCPRVPPGLRARFLP